MLKDLCFFYCTYRFKLNRSLFLTEGVGYSDTQRRKCGSECNEGHEEVIVVSREHCGNGEDDVDEVGEVQHRTSTPPIK